MTLSLTLKEFMTWGGALNDITAVLDCYNKNTVGIWRMEERLEAKEGFHGGERLFQAQETK